ncbi:FMO3-like protein, partial [Mya arenaria]
MSDAPPQEGLPLYLTGRHLLEYLQRYDRQHNRGNRSNDGNVVHSGEYKQADDGDERGTAPGKSPVYLTGRRPLEYLQLYARQHDLNQYVQLNTERRTVPRGLSLYLTGRCLLGYIKLHARLHDLEQYVKLDTEVHLSTWNGLWLGEVRAARGRPFDMILSRFTNAAMHYFPSVLNKVIAKILNAKFDHELYGSCPKFAPFQSTMCLSDELSYKLMAGKVKIKKFIKCFTKTGVEFVDGDEVNNEKSRKWRSATLVHASQVDYVPFMDDIATRIGCKPRIGWLLLTDTRLALRCLFRACTSYQFRLHGPDAWKGARAAIMGQDDRTFSSFRETRNRDGGQQGPNQHWLRWLMVVGLLAAFVSKVL